MLTDNHRAQIVILIQELIGDPNRKVTDDLRLMDDLGLDSLDAVGLSVQLEEWVADLRQIEPEIEIEDWEKWETVGDIMQTVEKML